MRAAADVFKHAAACCCKRRYGELLREIRQENIANILFFDTDHFAELDTPDGWTPIEGACLVVFKDGHLEQAYIPPQDVRMQCASRFLLLKSPACQLPARSRTSTCECMR